MSEGRKTTVPVSVIVPCYNASEYLYDCIYSVQQGIPPDEIIIIDDCSTDGSSCVMSNLQHSYDNVHVFSTETNVGALLARSLGLSKARNDWISFVDADDLIEDNAISEAYYILSKLGGDICIWDMWRFDSGRVWPNMHLDSSSFPKSGREAVLATLDGWKIHPLGVAKKKLYTRAYQEFRQSWINADELVTRLVFAEANRVDFCGRRYFYRVNASSTTRRLCEHRLSSLHSHLWLVEFAKRYPEADGRAIVRNSIAEAWFYFLNRKKIGPEAVLNALREFFSRLIEITKFHRWVWRHPKHFAAFITMQTTLVFHNWSRS